MKSLFAEQRAKKRFGEGMVLLWNREFEPRVYHGLRPPEVRLRLV